MAYVDCHTRCSGRFRIGFSIARRLGLDGARVLISSRKQANVDEAVQKLRNEKVEVDGMVCHVGKASDRESLVRTVSRWVWIGSGSGCHMVPWFPGRVWVRDHGHF